MAALKAILGGDVTVFDHPEVKTVDEWAPELQKIGGVAAEAAMGKNLFLKGKKGELCLVFALASTKTDLKLVGQAVGSPAMRFAPEDVLKEFLGVVQGAVTPLALINDKEKKVIVALDSELQTFEGVVAVHPCRNDKTVLVTFKQLQEYIAALGHTPLIVDFSAAPAAPAAAPAKKPVKEAKKEVAKGETKLGLDARKEDDFAAWYSQVITKSEMIEYYDVSGCYIIRPWAYQIWEEIKAHFARKIRNMGVEDCYFPMFVTQSVLNKEKDHVEGFAPEVAWITKAGDNDLANPIALRPTSETVMYPYFAKWIRSHRDLPLRLNQWCNVVRWEFSHPTPFIRTREFLWQEGHCAWATFDDCEKEVRLVLNHYASVYEELLAVPVVQGVKTEKEKFAGGHSTTTVETFIAAVGRGCQGATSHNLGQNFGKMFDISFEDPTRNDGSKSIPFQNSWGLTTRTIGVMTMVHGDNVGLVLPPRVASVQVVIVPVGITATTSAEGRKEIFDACTALQDALQQGDIRAKADLRDNYSPAWRFNHWELKGVPIRIELGPNEVASKKLMLCIRHNMTRKSVDWVDTTLVADIKSEMDSIHDAMLSKARTARAEQTKTIVDWTGFTPALNEKCLILAPWCGQMSCEDRIKVDSADESKALIEGFEEDVKAPSMGAKSLCIPFEQPAESAEGHKCICKGCTSKASKWVLWGRSF